MERAGGVTTKRADAVFEGGGVKGIGLVGALAAFEDEGYRWMNVAGTSAGAITAALVAAGYTAAEMKQELDRLLETEDARGNRGYEQFKDTDLIDRIPGIGAALSIGREKGLYEGDFFEEWLRGLLAAKGVHTFADLLFEGAEDAPKQDPYRYRLRVVASDLTRKRMIVLPQDIADYEDFGGDPDQVDVARAVRMSMSIPFFFEPVTLTATDEAFPRRLAEADGAAETGKMRVLSAKQRACTIVDGGLLSNFPVHLFDSAPGQTPAWPTFGFKLVGPNDNAPNEVRGPISLTKSIISTLLEVQEQRHMEPATAVRTVRIRTEEVRTTQFDLDRRASDALHDRGRQGAAKFFKRWESGGGFEGYIKRFRTPGAEVPDQPW